MRLHQIVDIAAAIEQETGIPCGKQDHYASLLGGINFLQCKGESVEASPLQLTEEIFEELHNSLLLVYTGESHFSGNILQNVVDAYRAGNQKTRNALKVLRRIANERPPPTSRIPHALPEKSTYSLARITVTETDNEIREIRVNPRFAVYSPKCEVHSDR